MTRARQDRLLGLLVRDGEWVDGGDARRRSRGDPAQHPLVRHGDQRARAGRRRGRVRARRATAPAPDAAAALRTTAGADAGTPRDRLHTLVRALLDADDGIDVFETADALHVSPATLDADLARVRGLLGGTELTLERSASRARLRGTEMAQRRLLSKLAHDEMDAGSFDLEALRRTLGEGSVGAHAFGPFKTELVAELGALGYFVNEFGISDVVMHIAIAADRVASDRGLEGTAGEVRPAQQEVAAILERLVRAPPRRDPRRGRPAAPVDPRADPRRRAGSLRAVRPRAVAPRARGRGGRARGRRDRGRGVPRRHRPRGLHPAPRPARAEPAAPRARAGVVAQSAHEVAQVDVPDDLRGGGLHRERPAAAPRHPAAGRRDRLHRDARRRAARAQPPRRPAADRDDRLPRLLRAARAAALVGRPLPRPGDRGRRRRDARRPRLGLDRHRPRADHDRSGRRRRPVRAHPAVPHRRRRRARADRGRAHPPLPPPRPAAQRARALLRALRVRAGAGRRRRRGGRHPPPRVAAGRRGRDRPGLRRAHDRARAALVHGLHRRARRAARARA